MTITELAIKRPTLVVVVFSFLGVLGIYGFLQMKYDLMPKMTAPMIIITTMYPGGAPSEVETSVTKVIEDAVSGIDKVSAIHSSSFEGMSIVVVEFDMDANIDFAVQDAQRKVNESSQRLPRDVRTPVITKYAFAEIPVLKLSVKGNMPNKDFYQFVKDKVQPRIAKLSGVGLITMVGGEEREILVNVDLQKLKSYNLSLAAITNTIKAGNVDFPTGKILGNENQFVVRVAGKFQSLEDIKNLVIGKSKQGGEFRVRDVANVVDGHKEIETINRLNGIDAVGLTVQKQSNANTVDVSHLVRAELKQMEKDYAGQELKFQIAQDASDFIVASAKAVWFDLLFAIILVSLVMLTFLHSLRNSLIIMVAIPTSLISTFFMMYIFGFTFNMMTLLAMSLVIGILVDDSIVVLENIYRHLEMGKTRRDAALTGRNEIGFAAMSITLVDVVVFVPLALITGIVGNFLREYSLVVVFSTLMSLFVSFTITPTLASRFTKLEHLAKNTILGVFGLWFENFFKRIINLYARTLKWALNHGKTIVLLSFLLFISSFLLAGFGFIGFEFIPVTDRGEVIINLELESGSSVANTNYYAQKVEEILSKMPEVKSILTNVGISSEGFQGLNSNNNAELDVTLVDKNQRNISSDAFSQKVRHIIQEIPGIKVRVSPVGLMGTSTRSPIEILVTGTDYGDVIEGANIVEGIIKKIKGTTDVRLSTEQGKPELRVEIDRKKMASLGLTIFDVGQTLKIALTGDDDSKYRQGVNEFSLRVQLDQFDRSNIDEVGNLSFVNNKGQQIFLKQFASIYQTLGPTKLEREDRISSVKVMSKVFGVTSGIATNEIRAVLNKTTLPPGVTWKVTGEQKYIAETMISLLYALFAGILFVYMIMVALYDSYIYPFVVLFSIPVAIVGALFALALTGKSLSIYSMLGVIMLIGLVAKNAILLIDRTNQMKLERGLSTFDALVEAGQTRLRPILMTTFAMVMGMMPIALSASAGSEAKSGLAIVLIGGLISSLMLTLVLVPVVYKTFDRFRLKKI